METDITASKHEYTAKFKEEAVRLVVSNQRRCAEIARNWGLLPTWWCPGSSNTSSVGWQA